MELLGSYGDDDSDDDQQDGVVRTGGEGDTGGTLPGSSANGTASAKRLLPNAQAASTDSPIATPGPGGSVGPRHHRFKVVSKSSTPVIHGSPAVHQNMSDFESPPNSPSRSAAAASEMPLVHLPQKPDGQVQQEVAERVEKYMKLRGSAQPVEVNRDLYDKKEFHNPGILEMLMSQYNIKEDGTNYPKELFNTEYPPILYFDQLRRSDSGAKRPFVQHVTVGGASDAATAAAMTVAKLAVGGGSAEVARKKNKWDNASRAGNLYSSLAGSGVPSISMPSTGNAALDFERIRQLTKKL